MLLGKEIREEFISSLIQNHTGRKEKMVCNVNCFVQKEEYNNEEYIVSCVLCNEVYVITLAAFNLMNSYGRVANLKTLQGRINSAMKWIKEEEEIISIVGANSTLGRYAKDRMVENNSNLMKYYQATYKIKSGWK